MGFPAEGAQRPVHPSIPPAPPAQDTQMDRKCGRGLRAQGSSLASSATAIPTTAPLGHLGKPDGRIPCCPQSPHPILGHKRMAVSEP